MNTSYFRKSGTHPDAVSISGKPPDWYTGRQYKALAPRYWFFKKYKADHDAEFYTAAYRREVLDPLDPQTVFNDLGPDAILLCYEKPGDFCHRRLVAEWLEEKLGVSVPEVA